ncbi:recombinase family protein [Aeromicrobium sp. HA]|uniref:recombinase family protein n=1 Tax=Aeromicrobium sp. HA TaxID=3009077 RepID=UPI0022AEFBE9|nr:recombinase family protein [Aeromicrobium sp. HA]
MAGKIRAAIYARISDDKAGEGLGVERQIEDCRRFIESKGWELAETYVDNSISASKGKRRPEYEAMLDAARLGRIDAIVSYNEDRLSRRLRDFLDLADLASECAIAIATIHGQLDLTTADGRMYLNVKAAFAQAEAERIAERVSRQKKQAAAVGRPVAAKHRTYGYARDWEVIDHEAEVVREIFSRRANGESASSICRDLNSRGESGTGGSKFDPTSIRRILTNRKYLGVAVLKGEVVGEGQWQPIVDLPAFEAAAAALKSRVSHSRAGKRPSLLKGLLRCGACRAPMHGHWRTNGVHFYTCSAATAGEHNFEVRSDWIDETVAAFALEQHALRLDEPSELAVSVELELAAIESEIAALLDRLRRREIDDETCMMMLDVKRGQKRELAARRQQSMVASRTDFLAQKRWSELGMGERRALVESYVKSVTIDPGAPMAASERRVWRKDRGLHHRDPRRLRLIDADGNEFIPSPSVSLDPVRPVSHQQLVGMLVKA